MGCGSGRLSREEALLAESTVLSGFEKQPVETVVSVIRTHHSAKLILKTQLQAIKKKLSLNTGESDRHLLDQFYARFACFEPNLKDRIQAVSPNIPQDQVGHGPFHREDWLLVCGILLSAGSAMDKAAALYFSFDEGFHNAMTQKTAEELLTLMFRVAVQDAPLLSRNREVADVQKYLAKAQRNAQRAVRAGSTLVMQSAPTTSIEEFVTRLTSYKDGLLTSVSGLRSFAVEQARQGKQRHLSAGERLVKE